MNITPNNDVAKCKGQDPESNHVCGYREQYLRYVRLAGDRQVWAEFWRTENDDCAHYLSIPRR